MAPTRPLNPAGIEGLTRMDPAWFYVDVTAQTRPGPFSVNQLGAFFATSSVIASTLVWSDGMEDWSPLSMIPSLYVQVTLGRIAFLPRPLTLTGGAHAAKVASGAVVETISGEAQSLEAGDLP